MPDKPIPEEIWEAARSLRNAVNWQSNASVEIVARALLARDERAAGVARAYADSESVSAIAGVAESKGVGSPGWRKDAMHSHAQEKLEAAATAITTYGGGNGE